MDQKVATRSREAVLVEDAHVRSMMGFDILEPVPTRSIPYERLDPFILLHEARFKLSELQDVDTKHPHRGFDNLWYILEGSASTGHSTGPGGTIERVRLPKGGLLALRTGRGAWHAEGIGAEERERRPRRHRVAERAVLGEPRAQGQADGTQRPGAASG